MLKLGGVVIPMQQNSNKEMDIIENITYLVGDAQTVNNMTDVCALEPFCDEIIEFLNDLSKTLLSNKVSRLYPDVITLGFWLRKGSVLKLKERFECSDNIVRVGRGVAFHIAPSNVAVNYAYSLVTGLLTGNANIVRISTKEFPQVSIINNAIQQALDRNKSIKPYICIVKYGRDQGINDFLSSLADVRIIWGGDATISQLRKSPLGPRASEISFADRYSLAVVDSIAYLNEDNKERIAEEFYNDTFLSDQNACTSPRIVIWIGNRKEEAQEVFWSKLHELVKKRYEFQPIQGINKLTSSYLMAVNKKGTIIMERPDNLIYRVRIPEIDSSIMELKDNSGYFFEYDCDDIMQIRELCNNTHCQTIGYIGDKDIFLPLLKSGIKGVDRIVPVGKTMDFDLIWDGYNLVERLTRSINII